MVAGRFQLVGQVATGGMGTVHRAFDRTRQRAVAVKLLTEVGSAEATERFRREANVLAELRHPGIVEFVDAGMLPDGGMYLAMQWLEGLDLAHKLVAGPLSFAESIQVVRGVAEALSVAHDRGILHRDVKPQNIFLREGDVARPVVLDFGIAALVNYSITITRAGMTMGTPGFMAPEQVRGDRSLDPRVDVYGMGCLLFHCITGTPPFVGDSPVAVAAEVLLSTAPRLRSRLPDVPRELDEFAAAMLSKELDGRPANGRAVAEGLRRIEALLPAPAPPSSPAVSARERRMVAVVAVLLPQEPPASNPLGTTPMRGTFLPKLAREHRGELRAGSNRATYIRFVSDESVTEAATRAATAALAVVGMDPMLRVSLAIGSSLVDGGLDPVLLERLDALASVPGAVLADPMARSTLLAKLTFAETEQGFRLLSTRAAEGPARLTPFVGRDRELRALLDTFDAVAAHRSARAVRVVAAPGLGKTRLLRELFVALEERDPTPSVIDARAEANRKETPLSLVGQLVRRGLTVVDGAQPDEQVSLLRSALEPLVDPSELTRATMFLSLAADLPIVDTTLDEVGAAMRDPQLLEDQVGRVLAKVFTGFVGMHRSLAILIDDAHAIDAVSARTLARAMRDVQGLPVCLVAFVRPDGDDRLTSALRDVPTERVELAPLPADASEQLVRAAVGERATEELVRRIVHQGEGSPFFLHELAAFAVEQKLETIPTGILASLEARLLRLDPTARKVLRAASVFGETFWYGGVAALLGEGTPEAKHLSEWLRTLVERELVTLRPTTRFMGETELAFRHSMMRDVAYNMLTREDRGRGHRLAAEWLHRRGEREPFVLATHLDAAGDPTSAAVYWLQAGKLAYERNDAARAVECIERALRQGLSAADRPAALVVLTNALVWMGQLDRAEQRGLEAVSAYAPGSQGWLEATTALVRVQCRRDEPAAIEALRRLVEAVRRDRSLRPVPETLSALIPTALRRGEAQLAADIINVLGDAALAHAPNDPVVRASILRCRSWQAMFDWNYTACTVYDREALECFRAAGDFRQVCQAHFDMGFDWMMLGQYERAEQMFLEALVGARQLGIEGLELTIEHNLSFTMHRLGKGKEALAMQKRCVELATMRRDRMAEVACRHYLAVIRYELGDHGAEVELEGCLGFAEAMSLRWSTLARLGLIALEKGSAGLAQLRIAEALRGMKELNNAEEGQIIIRLASIELARHHGEHERALAEIQAARSMLVAAASKIPDPDVRQSFLYRIPEHRRLLELPLE